MDAAVELVSHELAEIDRAPGRSAGAELSRAEAVGAPYQVSRLLAELVGAALRAARDTDGAVDPTVGARGARGPDAPDRLEGLGVPVRLVGADRSVHAFGGWPT